MKFRLWLYSLLLFTACSEGLDVVDSFIEPVPLTVVLRNTPIQKAQVEGNYMPDLSEIGVFLRSESGGNYDSQSYDNIKYTAIGTGSSQTWGMDPTLPIALSQTKGIAYAYYPRVETDVTLTNVTITNDGTDWMYSSAPALDISNKNPVARFEMVHAMTIVRCKISRGQYDGTGEVRAVSVKGSTLASGATLNLENPSQSMLSGVNVEIKAMDVGTLQDEPLRVDLWCVPAQTGSELTFSLRIDDLFFQVKTPTVNPAPGTVYNYAMTVDAHSLQVSNVTVSDWQEKAEAGLDSKLDVSDYAVDWDVAKRTDGVYAITSDGKALAAEYITDDPISGVAFVLYGKAYQVARFDALNSEGSKSICWRKADYVDIPSLPNYGRVNDYFGSGFLPFRDGSYTFDSEQRYIDGDWKMWPQYDQYAALRDVNGKENTEKIIEAQKVDGVVVANSMSEAVLLFRDDVSINEGHSDWFVPAEGQLAFMCLMKDDLNRLLTLLGGENLTGVRWSSSECSNNVSWRVDFSSCAVWGNVKNTKFTLRLIREL